MKEQTIEDIREELEDGLVIIACYFYETLGCPPEWFKEKIKKLGSFSKQLMFYLEFKKKYPKLFLDK